MKTNTGRRPLEIIADDIRALERGNAFAIGALLAEAREDAGYGEWMAWLEDEFDWGRETARNYLAAHRLAQQFPILGNLPLPMCAIYRLGNDFKPDDSHLPIIIEALTAATKGKSKMISVAEADGVIEMALLRIEHGDYPDATLDAIENQIGEPWEALATEALKTGRPTTEETAKQITDAAHREYVGSLYASFGGLPDDIPDDALETLGEVPEEQRAVVSDKLKYLPRPLTDEAILDCVSAVEDNAVKKQKRQEEIKDAVERAEQRSAKEAARKSADKAQQLPGPHSPAEIERKFVRLDELELKVPDLERMKIALDSEIGELKEAKLALESENKELRAAKPVMPSLIEALETALDLAREAARHDGGLSPSKAKKREKALTDIRSGLALLMQLEKEVPP